MTGNSSPPRLNSKTGGIGAPFEKTLPPRKIILFPFPGVVDDAYPQPQCRSDISFASVISRRSAGCGHDQPPLFDGINLLKTNTLRDEFVIGTPQLLMRVARARAAKWPSTRVPGHPASGVASNPPVPRAKPSAGNLFRPLDYDQRLLRVDTQLNPVYVE